MYKLPKQSNLNISEFSNLFKNTSTSYKYLFFQAMLAYLKETNFKKTDYSFELLEAKMLEIAEHPIKIYRLNFGNDDRVARKLHNKFEKIDLLKFVPYRLLSPFFTEQIKGLNTTATHKKIACLSQEFEAPSIYKIIDNSISIKVEWMAYFQENFAIIEAWSLWHWANYLQKKNPNVLAILNKLQKPSERLSLQKQTKYWQTVLNAQPFNCIYSGNKITPSNLSLDHFLPWSFIGHDQLWNLIPTSTNINASKSDNIPSMDKYLDNFIEVQKIGLEVAFDEMGKDRWQENISDFATDFNMQFSDLRQPNNDIFISKYKEIIMPLSVLAKNSGFNCEWAY
ncbi:hypothetical protein SPBRAN_1072 [uncultured Candidatus Thioglobus sp.]|nr:hypothetical protein SPBRAN_1072 [uncultured Candidatus Thioglobus sp.]